MRIFIGVLWRSASNDSEMDERGIFNAFGRSLFGSFDKANVII